MSLSYASSNGDVFAVKEENGKTILHGLKEGTADITVTAKYKTYSAIKKITLSYVEKKDIKTISVAEAIKKNKGEKVNLKGIISGGIANKSGFYLNDGTGTIAVTVADSKVLSSLNIGNTITLTGVRDISRKDESVLGETFVSDAVIAFNEYGVREADKSLYQKTGFSTLYSHVNETDENDLTTTVYTLSAKVKWVKSKYFSNVYLTNGDGSEKIGLYCSNAEKQYAFLNDYEGKTLNFEFMFCNWNTKKQYKGYVLSLTDPSTGTVLINKQSLGK